MIQNSVQDAVVADLDGDGQKEILYSSYDGRVHAYWLDKTEHGNWPYRVPSTGVGGDDFRFAGEPVVADLDNDGHAEVIFTSWPKNGGNRVGHLHILDYLGNELYRVSLPAPFGSDWNGGLAAPTLANIDGDADLEVVVGTTAEWRRGLRPAEHGERQGPVGHGPRQLQANGNLPGAGAPRSRPRTRRSSRATPARRTSRSPSPCRCRRACR